MSEVYAHGGGLPPDSNDQASYRHGKLQQWAVVAATGEIDLYTSPGLREALLAAGESSCQIIVDLTAVDFLDSTGLGVLVGGLRRSRASGGSVCLVGPIGSVRRVLEITRLCETFAIYSTLADVPMDGATEPVA